MADLTQRQIATLESYRRPATPLPGSGKLRNSRHIGYKQNVDIGLRKQIELAGGDAKKLREISREQHKTNSGYIEVIDYFKNIFYFRYIVIPTLKEQETERLDPDEMRQLSRKMVNIVDALSIETLFPKILEKGLIDGVVYLYLYMKGGAPNVIILPEKYCKRYRETNFDTETILFNFEYFRELEHEYLEYPGIETDDLLNMYPRQMVNQYKKYKNGGKYDGPQYQELNIQTSAAIPFHIDAIPPKIVVSAAKHDYDSTILNERLRNESQIDSIITVQIPLDNDKVPIFNAQEAGQIQSILSNQLKGMKGVRVLTSFGDVNLLKPQKNDSVQNHSVSNAYNQIFEEALINPQLFRADTDYALSVSLNRDAAFIWTILEKLMNYFNLALNRTNKFGNYELYAQLLPITKYNSREQQDGYRRAAEYGIGKLEAVVSTGIKQSAIYDKAELEHALQLDDILKPLQSSHTRSAQELKNLKEGITEEEEKEQTVEETNEQRESDEKSLEEGR